MGSYYQLYCSTIYFKVLFSSETFRGRGAMKGIEGDDVAWCEWRVMGFGHFGGG